MAVDSRYPLPNIEELSDEADDVLAVVAHDLRSPLADIILATQHLAAGHAGDITPDQRRLLDLIASQAQRAHDLASTLSVAHTQRARPAAIPRLQRERHDLAALTAAHVESAQLRAREQGITLTVDAGTEALAWFDPIRIEQAVDNLVSNALKFTPPGGRVTVTVDTRRSDTVGLAVADTGIGIAVDEQHLVGRPSFRGSTATRHAIPGTGLGLSIANAIVTAHGGELTVESAEGLGTTVRMELPRAPRALRLA